MLLQEQSLVLRYLLHSATASFKDVLRACVPGANAEWGARVLADLEWLGYITVFCGGDGVPLAVQLTEKGRGQIQPQAGRHRRAGGLVRP